jgi:hypothetical protein
VPSSPRPGEQNKVILLVVVYKSEFGKHVGVTILIPVSEGGPDQLRICCPAATLQYIVLSIEKVCRVSRIGRHGDETGQRPKHSARKLPAISNKILDAPCRGSLWMTASRRRAPRRPIDIGVLWGDIIIPPRIASFLKRILRRCIGNSLVLCFCRERSTLPFCVRRSFSPAYINRPCRDLQREK